MKEPENPDPLPKYIEQRPARRQPQRDARSLDRHDPLCIHEDTGLYEHPGTGLATRQIREEKWSIAPDDPLSMTGDSTWICDMAARRLVRPHGRDLIHSLHGKGLDHQRLGHCL